MTIRSLILTAFALGISIYDAKTLKIPDSLLLICFAILFIWDISHSKEILFFLENFLSLLIWFLVFYLVYSLSRGLGFGDVKYAALLGYAIGLGNSPIAFILIAFSAIIAYLICILILGWSKSAKLPFAPFIHHVI